MDQPIETAGWSNEAPGWGFGPEESAAEPNHNSKQSKVKQRSHNNSNRNIGKKQRGKNDDKNKYLKMETNNHQGSSRRNQNRRKRKSKSPRQQSNRRSSTKSSQRPQTLNYRISKAMKATSKKQANSKGLMMGPYDPSFTVRIEPPARPSKKKNKRNYYRKNKGR